jgi:hypothetical protein
MHRPLVIRWHETAREAKQQKGHLPYAEVILPGLLRGARMQFMMHL